MTDAHAPTGSDPDVAAAELALGLLEGDDRAVALRRSLAEPAFAREVERWRTHFAVLIAAIPAVAPPPEIERRLEARLDNPSLALSSAATRTPSRLWKGVAFATSIAAAAMFAVLMVRPTPTLSPPIVTATPAPMVAAFMIEGSPAPVVATYDTATARLSMPAAPGAVPITVQQGKSAQLWAIVGTGAPQPLGLFRQAGSRMEADVRTPQPIAPGATFAISIEPLGGSPTGAPTGPVIGTGTLIRA